MSEPVAWGEVYGRILVGVSIHRSAHYTLPLYPEAAIAAARLAEAEEILAMIVDESDGDADFAAYRLRARIAALKAAAAGDTATRTEGRGDER